VWEDKDKLYCLDGYHRCLVLKELEAEGFKVPTEFQADFLDCKDKKEAAKLVGIYSSIYAKVTQDGFKSFLEENELDLDDLKFEINIPDIDLDINLVDIEPVEDEPEKKETVFRCPECGEEIDYELIKAYKV